jgi:hypothetical protein
MFAWCCLFHVPRLIEAPAKRKTCTKDAVAAQQVFGTLNTAGAEVSSSTVSLQFSLMLSMFGIHCNKQHKLKQEKK